MSKFIQVHNKTLNVDQIAYIDFLESGRAMIFMSGLSHEKQNISVEPEEARRLKTLIESCMFATR